MIDGEDPYEHPTEMLRWFDEDAGVMFLSQVKEWLANSRHKLEKEDVPNEIFRLQGEVAVLKNIAHMPDDIRRLEADRLSGRIK